MMGLADMVTGLLSRGTMSGAITHQTTVASPETRHLTAAKATGTQLLLMAGNTVQDYESDPRHSIKASIGMTERSLRR